MTGGSVSIGNIARVIGLAAAVGCAFDSGGVGGGGGTGVSGGDDTSTGGAASTGVEPASSTPPETGDGDGDTSTSTSTSTTTGGEDSTGPFDPCAIDHGGCDVDATCEPDPSGEVAVCDCNVGFVGNGVDCAIAPVLETLRVEAECGFSALGYCDAGDVEAEVVLVGEPGTLYVVTLRVRGVVEERSYDGGAPDGLWNPGGEIADGVDWWNRTELAISAPAQSIRLNNGSSGDATCVPVDMTHDVVVEAGASLRLSIDTVDGSQAQNSDDVVIPGIPPAPEAFDGQFLQIDPVMIVPM